jgi:hypothetical protein
MATDLHIPVLGLSDSAIALGAMVGVRVSESFDAPWRARDPVEFWRRWHVSLGRRLRTYVFVPLGGSREDDASKVTVVFLLSALWHLWAAEKAADASGDPAPPARCPGGPERRASAWPARRPDARLHGAALHPDLPAGLALAR